MYLEDKGKKWMVVVIGVEKQTNKKIKKKLIFHQNLVYKNNLMWSILKIKYVKLKK